MALRRDMPIRDPQRAETDPASASDYSPRDGWWTRSDDQQPATGDQNGGDR